MKSLQNEPSTKQIQSQKRRLCTAPYIIADELIQWSFPTILDIFQLVFSKELIL